MKIKQAFNLLSLHLASEVEQYENAHCLADSIMKHQDECEYLCKYRYDFVNEFLRTDGHIEETDFKYLSELSYVPWDEYKFKITVEPKFKSLEFSEFEIQNGMALIESYIDQLSEAENLNSERHLFSEIVFSILKDVCKQIEEAYDYIRTTYTFQNQALWDVETIPYVLEGILRKVTTIGCSFKLTEEDWVEIVVRALALSCGSRASLKRKNTSTPFLLL